MSGANQTPGFGKKLVQWIFSSQDICPVQGKCKNGFISFTVLKIFRYTLSGFFKFRQSEMDFISYKLPKESAE